MTTAREINAAVKKQFKAHPAFVPAKFAVVGSFLSLRFEGDLPMSLVEDVRRWMNDTYSDTFRTILCGPHRWALRCEVGFVMGGTVITWYLA